MTTVGQGRIHRPRRASEPLGAAIVATLAPPAPAQATAGELLGAALAAGWRPDDGTLRSALQMGARLAGMARAIMSPICGLCGHVRTEHNPDCPHCAARTARPEEDRNG